MVDQANELPDVGPADKGENVFQFRVPVMGLPALNEQDLAQKVIYHGLILGRTPPLCGKVVFPSGDDDPETPPETAFLNLRDPPLLGRR